MSRLQERFDIANSVFKPEKNHCSYDQLLVHAGPVNNQKRVGSYCGSEIPGLINSESNIMMVEFHSDDTVERSGFKAEYFTDTDECALGEHNCDHTCRNLIGSYECSCNEGYELYNKYRCKES
ncbi:Dorsal-ventral patterning tolloid-like protein 1 [Cichlidogyrus casuarinus]|uniref:Dorsal-ventral patterning tolloid-like protein 1 n=1 Tax=Cichlidogyrus casuarinus TaxID=1844966 RepID=A0ABD2PPT7_9PLAT